MDARRPLVMLALGTMAGWFALGVSAGGSCGTCGPTIDFPPVAGGGVVIGAGNLGTTRESLDSADAEIVLGTTCQKNNAHPTTDDAGLTVAWVTRAPADLAFPSPGPKTQVYVRRNDGSLATVMVSQSQVGPATPQGYSEMPRLSGDGDWLAFVSSSRRLTVEDTLEIPSYLDVFLYHVPTGAVERLSEDPLTKAGGNGDSGGIPSISNDGNFVAFESVADDLPVSGPCSVLPGQYLVTLKNGKTRRARTSQVYLRDRRGTFADPTDDCLDWISHGSDFAGGCAQPNGPSSFPSVSANGCLVAFESQATNLLPAGPLPGGTPGQVYVHDRTTGVTTLVSHDATGGPADAAARRPRVSADGRWISFDSVATNLVAGDTNGKNDIFVYEVATGTVTRVNLDPGSVQLGIPSMGAELSGSGRFVAYTRAPGLPSGYEFWLVDRDPNDDGAFTEPAFTKRISVDTLGGDPDGWCGGWPFTLTTDGRHASFMSIASDLITVPVDGNCVGASCAKPVYDCDDGRDVFVQPLY